MVDETMTPQELVENVLLGGGVTVSNVMFNGVASPGFPQDGLGSFTQTGTTLGLGDGVVLATGFLSSIPTAAADTIGDALFYIGDTDLEILTGGEPTFDAVILEFDFVPNGDELNFRYVFASDEYPDYVCSEYNDAFGFFVSGPGIVGPFTGGAENIALLPGSNIPIAINTVNNGIAGNNGIDSYCDSADPNWLANTVYYMDNFGSSDIVFNGFTAVMEATVDVVCGETYHIKIAVADAGDDWLDSGVFLEAGSFSSPGQVIPDLQAGVGIVGDVIMEGCGPVEFIFTRSGDLDMGATVDIMVAGTSTAGVDYDPPFPAQITFAPGEATQSIMLDVPMDLDLQETIIITLTGAITCTGVNAEFTFYIENTEPLLVTLDDISVSCGTSGEFIPEITGGVGEYEYLWSTGETTETIIVSPIEDTEYELTVSDACGVLPVLVTATATTSDLPLTLEVSEDIGVLCGEEVEIGVIEVTGGNNVYDYAWTLDNVPVGFTQTLSVTEPGYYVLTVTEGCGG
ncbi:MAG: choice-of-anchor L domain-containing protein, partial [Bacteroidota bacterium]|nr:choice-of-anchor L domain-containing protein [Bacteroidota bacterium]